MGRKKIVIAPLQNERNRSVTYLKRRTGLFKKAHELAVLTQADVAVIVFGQNGKLSEFCSRDIDQVLLRYTEYKGVVDRKGPADFAEDQNDEGDDDDAGGDDGAEEGGSYQSSNFGGSPSGSGSQSRRESDASAGGAGNKRRRTSAGGGAGGNTAATTAAAAAAAAAISLNARRHSDNARRGSALYSSQSTTTQGGTSPPTKAKTTQRRRAVTGDGKAVLSSDPRRASAPAKQESAADGSGGASSSNSSPQTTAAAGSKLPWGAAAGRMFPPSHFAHPHTVHHPIMGAWTPYHPVVGMPQAAPGPGMVAMHAGPAQRGSSMVGAQAVAYQQEPRRPALQHSTSHGAIGSSAPYGMMTTDAMQYMPPPSVQHEYHAARPAGVPSGMAAPYAEGSTPASQLMATGSSANASAGGADAHNDQSAFEDMVGSFLEVSKAGAGGASAASSSTTSTAPAPPAHFTHTRTLSGASSSDSLTYSHHATPSLESGGSGGTGSGSLSAATTTTSGSPAGGAGAGTGTSLGGAFGETVGGKIAARQTHAGTGLVQQPQYALHSAAGAPQYAAAAGAPPANNAAHQSQLVSYLQQQQQQASGTALDLRHA